MNSPSHLREHETDLHRFHLIKFQLNRGLTTEHIDSNVHAISVGIEFTDNADEILKRTVSDAYVIADSVDQIHAHLQPGDLALYRIQPAQDEAFVVEYYLEKALS